MCRRNLVPGMFCLGMGLGLLLCCIFGGSFFFVFLGLLALILGFLCCRCS